MASGKERKTAHGLKTSPIIIRTCRIKHDNNQRVCNKNSVPGQIKSILNKYTDEIIISLKLSKVARDRSSPIQHLQILRTLMQGEITNMEGIFFTSKITT
jgi:hypothetical protein